MNGTAATLDIKDARASYGSAAVLWNLTLDIQRNERWAIIGRNGTGKSTLIKLIAGLLAPEMGTILVNGIERKWS